MKTLIKTALSWDQSRAALTTKTDRCALVQLGLITTVVRYGVLALLCSTISCAQAKLETVRSYLISEHAITYCEASLPAWEEQIEPNFRSCSARKNDFCFARNLGGEGAIKRLVTPPADPAVFGSCMYVTLNSGPAAKQQMAAHLRKLRPDWSAAQWALAAKILGVAVDKLLVPA